MRKVFASVLVIIFIFFSSFVAYSWGFYKVVTDDDFFNDEFSQIFYDYSVYHLTKDVDVQGFSSLSSADFREIVEDSISLKDFEFVIEDMFNQVKDGGVDENNLLTIGVPKDWFNEKIDLIGDKVAERLYLELPECDEPVSGFSDSIECVPSEIDEGDFKIRVKNLLDREAFDELPNVFSIELPRALNGAEESPFDYWTNWAETTFKVSLYSMTGVLLIVLVGIGLLIMKPWQSVLTWESGTVFFASLLTVFPLLVLKFLSNIFVSLSESGELNELSTQDVDFIQNVYDHIVGTFIDLMLIYVVPIMIISLGLWIYALVSSRQKVDV